MLNDAPAQIAGVDPLIERYDGFLLDQFGVLHDGQRAFAGALAALEAIRDAGRRVIILSNSGKRASPNIERLRRLGSERYLFNDLMSSGETAWRGLQARNDLTFAGLGRRCLFISRGGDHSAIHGLDIQATDQPEDATFVFLAGLDGDEGSRHRIERLLDKALRRKLPLLCTNPDIISLEGERRVAGPGALAADYAQAGGDVRYVGKPWPAIYRAALQRINLRVDRLAAVGDSLEHDIKGAEAFGIDGVLIADGVHREALSAAPSLLGGVARLANDAGCMPRWVMSRFDIERPSDIAHAS